MIKYTFLLIVTMLFISCKSGNQSTHSTTANSNIDTIPFHGSWVDILYINELIKTKSPRAAQEYATFLTIPISNKMAAYAFTYHEGGPDLHIYYSNRKYYLKSDANIDDSTLVVFTDKEKIVLGNSTYVRTDTNSKIPEKLLFKGAYKHNDKQVTFLENGSITGLDSITFYSVVNDYIADGMDSVDVIYLGTEKDPKQMFCFSFNVDTLYINTVKCLEKDEHGNCLDIRKDRLKYTLIKERN